jgi:hypothetical protein
VALCDNKYQGIVPVPEKIGNGQNPDANLYWGAGYGVKNFFHRKSDNWKLIKVIKNPSNEILERVIFKSTQTNTYLLADAYDGAMMRKTIIDFLSAASGNFTVNVTVDSLKLSFGANAQLLAFVGHNGLMDFNLDTVFIPKPNDIIKREVIILACYSKSYFSRYIKQCNAYPLIWTTGLMAAEAYTLKWIIDGWLNKENVSQIKERAAQAYHTYQKCGIKAARYLFTSGF